MKKALFLDRDGIINVDHGYVYKIEDFEFNEGIFELLRLFLAKGYLLFIVTNQSGIGRGYYSEEDFQKLTEWMLNVLKKEHIIIQSVEYCKHAPEAHCSCRKPQIGMVTKILQEYAISLENSWLIGDKQSDIDLANNAKIIYSVAIGKRDILNATLSFPTILELKEYFQTNRMEL